jgi:hypothetical protein
LANLFPDLKPKPSKLVLSRINAYLKERGEKPASYDTMVRALRRI